MSDRVTRSSARLVADPPAAGATSISANLTSQTSTSSKKRKAPVPPDTSPVQTSTEPTSRSSSRRSKRQKVADPLPQPLPTEHPPRASRRRGVATEPAMSNSGYDLQDWHHDIGLIDNRNSSKHTEESSPAPQISKTASKRPSSRNKKSQGMAQSTQLKFIKLIFDCRNLAVYAHTSYSSPEKEIHETRRRSFHQRRRYYLQTYQDREDNPSTSRAK
jgi:hypothetical protein